MKNTFLYWQNLKSDFMEYLKSENSNPKYLKDYSRTIDLLFEYAGMNDYAEYTPEMGYAFWEAEKSKDYKGKSTLARRRKAIKRLNVFLFGKTYWQKEPHKLRTHQSSNIPLECPEQFAEEFENFLQYLRNDGLKEVSIDLYRGFGIKYILCDFAEQGVQHWRDINARTLTTAFSHCTNKVKFATQARRLFGYLQKEGVVKNDHTGILPMVTKRKTVPSVYSEEEIKQLLDSIETVTPQGKRDHTMVLIAVRLGLRVSDIANLCFENVDFARSIVKFVQYKTSVPHQLPLPDDVADAIRDYIDNGREESDEPFIFLDGYGHPLCGHTVSHIGRRHISQSGVEAGDRHQGMHALRMSFASQLIAEQMPYDVVRYALGQVDPNATRHYVQFAIESLRACSLEVPPPSGLFKQYLEGGM